MSPITLWRKNATMDGRKTDVVPCGKCVKCLKRRANHWTFRLSQELKHATSACFLTLTYEQAPITDNGLPTLVKSDFQKFMKRLRKKSRSSLKYYACGEYGTRTQRPHYHMILFNLEKHLINLETITSIWAHGHIDVKPVQMACIAYVTGYVVKGKFERLDPCKETGLLDDRLPEFSLMSKKLGMSFLTPQMHRYLVNTMTGCVVLEGGRIQSLPRYFRDKVFSKMERKLIAEEYARIREVNWNDFKEHIYTDFIQKKDLIRKSEKQSKLKRLQL